MRMLNAEWSDFRVMQCVECDWCGRDYAGEQVRCRETIDVRTGEKKGLESLHEEGDLSAWPILFERHLDVFRRA